MREHGIEKPEVDHMAEKLTELMSIPVRVCGIIYTCMLYVQRKGCLLSGVKTNERRSLGSNTSNQVRSEIASALTSGTNFTYTPFHGRLGHLEYSWRFPTPTRKE
jgi:hypothetical protein